MTKPRKNARPRFPRQPKPVVPKTEPLVVKTTFERYRELNRILCAEGFFKTPLPGGRS